MKSLSFLLYGVSNIEFPCSWLVDRPRGENEHDPTAGIRVHEGDGENGSVDPLIAIKFSSTSKEGSLREALEIPVGTSPKHNDRTTRMVWSGV